MSIINVSRGHLQCYCDEFAFRYEHRKASDAERAPLLVLHAEGKRLTYQQPEGLGAQSARGVEACLGA